MTRVWMGNQHNYKVRDLPWLDALYIYFQYQDKDVDLFNYVPQYEDCDSEGLKELTITVEVKPTGETSLDPERNVTIHHCKRIRPPVFDILVA